MNYTNEDELIKWLQEQVRKLPYYPDWPAAQRKVTFFLDDTTVDQFMDWLEYETRKVSTFGYPTEDGQIIHLECFWGPSPPSDQPYWSLCGIVAKASEALDGARARARSGGDNWLGSLISFDPRQISRNRLMVEAECTHPAVMRLFEGLLHLIGRIWPEAAKQVGWVGVDPVQTVEGIQRTTQERRREQLEAGGGEALGEIPERQKPTKRSPRPYAKGRRKKVLDLSVGGTTIAGIAANLGCSESTVKRDRRWLKEEGQL